MNRFLIVISVLSLVFAFGCLEKEKEAIVANGQGEKTAGELQQAEEAIKAEAARIAEEARKAEAARIAEEARKAEAARTAEEARIAEEARKAEAARTAEEARIAEEARKAEEARIAEEAKKAEAARIAEKARKKEKDARANNGTEISDEGNRDDKPSFSLVLSIAKTAMSTDCKVKTVISQDNRGEEKFKGDFSDNRMRLLQSNWGDKEDDFLYDGNAETFYSKSRNIQLDTNKRVLSDKIQAVVFEHKDISDKSLAIEFQKDFLSTAKKQKGKYKNVVTFDKDLTLKVKDKEGKINPVYALQYLNEKKPVLEFEGLESVRGENVSITLNELSFGDFEGDKIKKGGFKKALNPEVSQDGNLAFDLKDIIDGIPGGQSAFAVLTISKRFLLENEWVPNNDEYSVKIYIEISDSIKVNLTK